MSVPKNLRPSFTKKTFGAMKAKQAVNRITFYRTEASNFLVQNVTLAFVEKLA